MWQSLAIQYNKQVRINANHHLQVLFDPSLRGGGSEGAGRDVCAGGVVGEVKSELELGDSRKQQIVQLTVQQTGVCTQCDQRWRASDEFKYESTTQHL